MRGVRLCPVMTRSLVHTVFICAVAVWSLIRLPHEIRARRLRIRVDKRDLRERLLVAAAVAGLAVIPIASIASGEPRFANAIFRPALAWAGIAVFIAALALVAWTHATLGSHWSPSLQIREKHELVTGGPYAYVRHPMYASFFLWAVAQALLLPNWIAGFSGIIGFGMLFALRVDREEAMMLQTFGDAYAVYMKRTARLIPFVY